MTADVKISLSDLREYFLVDFAQGKPLAPAFHGKQLVDTQRSNGVLVHMDSLGSPVLRDDFVAYMDGTSYGLRVPYERVAAIYNDMARPVIESYQDEKMSYLHATLTWWAFWRRQGMTAEAFAERKGVNERTVRRWLIQALRHVEHEIRGPVPLVFPLSYIPMEDRA